MVEPLFPAGAALLFGATGGIGRAVASRFAEAGSDLALVCHSRQAEAAELKCAIERQGRQVSTHRCDVSRQGAAAQTFDEAVSAHARIHTLLWAAGPLVQQVTLADVSPEQWRQAISVEVNGFIAAAQAAIPHMREKGGGSIVHFGSAGDLRWPDKDGLSVVPKAANEALVKGIAREEGRHGIRANSVLVGVIEAGMFVELSEQGAFDEAWAEEVRKNLALKRWGKPEEVGDAAVFLASSKAAYVTGQQIAVAGGYGI